MEATGIQTTVSITRNPNGSFSMDIPPRLMSPGMQSQRLEYVKQCFDTLGEQETLSTPASTTVVDMPGGPTGVAAPPPAIPGRSSTISDYTATTGGDTTNVQAVAAHYPEMGGTTKPISDHGTPTVGMEAGLAQPSSQSTTSSSLSGLPSSSQMEEELPRLDAEDGQLSQTGQHILGHKERSSAQRPEANSQQSR